MEERVAKESDLEPGALMAVSAGSYEIVLFRHSDGSFRALEDRCSHADVQLSLGTFEDGQIECMAHGARFDARSGQQLCMPAVCPVRSFEVKVVNGDVFVVLPE